MPECPNRYRDHRFPREVSAHAVRLYLRFAPSVQDVEELLTERGVPVSYETVRPRSRATRGRQRGSQYRAERGRGVSRTLRISVRPDDTRLALGADAPWRGEY